MIDRDEYMRRPHEEIISVENTDFYESHFMSLGSYQKHWLIRTLCTDDAEQINIEGDNHDPIDLR